MNVEKVYSNTGQLIKGPLVFNPETFDDSRGFFYESFNLKLFKKTLYDLSGNNDQFTNLNFVQDNHSKSFEGVLRGLHFQTNPCSQGKLVRCIIGEVYDVLVDLRKSSDTFLHWAAFSLSQKNKKQVWIPSGFAHGFLTLSKEAEINYKTTKYWDAKYEKTIRWDDPKLNIQWPNFGTKICLSDKDQNGTFCESLKKSDLFK